VLRLFPAGESHRAILDFAVKLTERPAEITDADLERLEEQRFIRGQSGISAALLPSSTSRTGSPISRTMRLNEEFYEIGRAGTDNGK